MKLSFLSLACTVSLALAAPHRRDLYALKDKHPVPSKWTQIRRAPKDHTISLRIGLKQGSFAELEKQLYQVSDPSHEKYGQHLSQSEVHKLVAPSETSLAAVHDWLEENNVSLDTLSYSQSKDWVVVALPVSAVENLLDTEYHVYEDDEGTQMVRTPHYSLPRALHRHIDVVQPTNYFGDAKRMGRPFNWRYAEAHVAADQDLTPANYDWNSKSASAGVSAVCNASAVTNLCLRTLYNTVDYVPQAPKQNSVALTAYLNETANISDFHVFLSRQRKDATLDYTFNVTQIAGGINMQGLETTYYGERDVEANLDAQTIGGLCVPLLPLCSLHLSTDLCEKVASYIRVP